MPATTMDSKTAANGKLISVEGDADFISTQLRLLPPSQKILILPSLLEDLPEQDGTGSFNARAFIRNVHTAFTERVATAHSFLQAATISQPRLAFMNGGAVAARSICILQICENCTDGDIEGAEAIFDDIVKDGVFGLMQLHELHVEDEEILDTQTETDYEAHLEDSSEYDTARSTGTPESLGHKRISRQESTLQLRELLTHNRDGIPNGRWRSSSQPYTPRPRDILFSTSDIVRTLIAIPEIDRNTLHAKRYTIASSEDSLPTPPTFPKLLGYQTYQSEVDEEELDHQLSSNSPAYSATSTPQAVIFGEACIVDVQPTASNKLRRVVSVDHLLPGNLEPHGFILENKRLRHSSSDRHLRNWPQPIDRLESFPEFPHPQTTTFLKASQMTIKKSPKMSLKLSPSITRVRRIYVDRGTDAVEEITQSSMSNEVAPFEPVFPVVEDLVIYFNDGSSDPILDSVILSYKNGAYPKLPNKPTTEVEKPHGEDELELSSSNSNSWPLKHEADTIDTVLALPTPSITPPPVSTGCFDKFYAFSPFDVENAIEVQNTLRLVLGLYFPREENYSQFIFSVISEADRFWKPVFGSNEDILAHGDSTIDHIIALGCEEGVNQDLFSQISGQVEQLGMKRDGTNRSGRLDLRYLISNVLQTLSLPTSKYHGRFDAGIESKLLAELLVPHIEAYLAANNSVRLLLLLYPTEHLPTVVSLRTLLGQKLFKIAGVLDSHKCDPPSRTRPRTLNAPHPLSNEAFVAPKSPISYQNISRTNSSIVTPQSSTSSKAGPASTAISFSHANYLLPSIATDSEIATFLSGIWATLIEKSSYYTPEPELEPLIVEKIVERFIEKPSLPPTPTSSFHRHSHRASVSARKSSAKIAKLTGSEAVSSNPRSGSPEKGGYATSTASTTVTARAMDSKRWRTEDMGDGIENFYLEEEDSEEDDWDRMIMGRAGSKPLEKAPEGKKGIVVGSKKKALKWLGLA